MNNNKSELEAYFSIIGGLGKTIEFTDISGLKMDLASSLKLITSDVLKCKTGNGRIFFIGNGGSAGIASHMATDWMKNGGFKTLCFNDGSLLTCIGNDLGFENVFSLPVSMHLKEEDILFAISSSGKSSDIIKAVLEAKKIGGTVITLSGFKPNNPLRNLGDYNFYVQNELYGFVEIAHLAICHAILDTCLGWNSSGSVPVAYEVDI